MIVKMNVQPDLYCNGFAQSVAKQRLGKQTSTEGLFSVRSAP
jgi:hypothetical protein